MKSKFLTRAGQGVAEGAIWGGIIGLVRGVIHLFRSDRSWWQSIGGSLIAGLLVGAVVCSIGRGISGKLPGAWIGAVIGLFVGTLLLADLFGGYWWTPVVQQPDGTFTTSGKPVGQTIGAAVGALVGAVAGSSIERILRRDDKSAKDGSLSRQTL